MAHSLKDTRTFLSYEQKIEVVARMQHRIETGESALLCIALVNALENVLSANEYTKNFFIPSAQEVIQNAIEYLPELLPYRPEGVALGDKWWPEYDKESRLDVLGRLNTRLKYSLECSKLLTLEEKIELLYKARGLYLSDNHLGVCVCIYAKSDRPGHALDIIPELLHYKPVGVKLGGYWWDKDERGSQTRLEVFDELIEELELQLPNKGKGTLWNKIVKFFKGLF